MTTMALQKCYGNETHRDFGKSQRGPESYWGGKNVGSQHAADLQNGSGWHDSAFSRPGLNQNLPGRPGRVDQEGYRTINPNAKSKR